MASMALPGGVEVIYVGMYGFGDGGATVPGHVFGTRFDPTNQAIPAWKDLSLNPVTNDTAGLNVFGKDISSIVIDPHDATGNTVYITVEGVRGPAANVRVVYRSIDGGAHWQEVTSNLSPAPANGLVVDPLDANTVYLATDAGVFATRGVSRWNMLLRCRGADGQCKTDRLQRTDRALHPFPKSSQRLFRNLRNELRFSSSAPAAAPAEHPQQADRGAPARRPAPTRFP